jgi:hypothetical protein
MYYIYPVYLEIGNQYRYHEPWDSFMMRQLCQKRDIKAGQSDRTAVLLSRNMNIVIAYDSICLRDETKGIDAYMCTVTGDC